MFTVCRRFYKLMTSSRLWCIAFSRRFPGPANLLLDRDSDEYHEALLSPRIFTRLNSHTSWMNEYVWRTKLLRSFLHGRPGLELAVTRRKLNKNSAGVTYESNNSDFVSHIDGSFNSDAPFFIHGAVRKGTAATSDPVNGDPVPHTWPTSLDPLVFRHFDDLYPADAPYGLGAGELVGQPNVMDVSQSYGFVYGEGFPKGRAHFTPTDDRVGMWLTIGAATAKKEQGIPDVHRHRPAITALWIAKSQAVPRMSDSSCGIFCGFANGFVSAYAVSSRFCSVTQIKPGDITANWALSPGVPIISIQADDSYSYERKAKRRIWAVALNALGEVFYLKDVPVVKGESRPRSRTAQDVCAWRRGRTVRWELVEKSRRRKKARSFHHDFIDVDFCPRSYSDFMELNEDMITTETEWIDNYTLIPPGEWSMAFHDWDMQRSLLVDFGGNDRKGAGESVIVIGCHNMPSSVKRYTRFHEPPGREPSTRSAVPPSFNSIFNSYPPIPSSGDSWHTTTLSTLGEKGEFTASAIDLSTLSRQTTFEDPMLDSQAGGPCEPSNIPGQRARLIAIGNSSGTINIWDARSQVPRLDDVTNILRPICVIQTSSPGISSLALNSLYLVHGGTDGLIQAWDPLGSRRNKPIRTLHSPSSARTRRRLKRMFENPHSDDKFIPNVICLDPNPKRLRGLVALGSELRYWSFRNGGDLQLSPGKDHIDVKTGKRLITSKPTRDLNTYIQDEWEALQLEREETEQQHQLLSERFGTDLLGADAKEEDLIAYATLLNDEARAKKASQAQVENNVIDEPPKSISTESGEIDSELAEALRRSELENSSEQSSHLGEAFASSSKSPLPRSTGNGAHGNQGIPLASGSGTNSALNPEPGPGSGPDGQHAGSSNNTQPDVDDEDLRYAIQLSIAENLSRQDALNGGFDIDIMTPEAERTTHHEEFPPLGFSSSQAARKDKGKGKGVIWQQP